MTGHQLSESHTAGVRLWSHQEEAVRAAVKVLSEQERTILVMACGTGKTVTGGEVARRLIPPDTGRVLVVAPTTQLLGQTVEQWRRAFGTRWLGQVVAVCADRDVLPRRGWDRGLPRPQVTIDAEHLARIAWPGTRVTVCCTYQSLHTIESAHRDQWMPRFDLVIGDEIHRAVGEGNTWGAVYDAHRIRSRRWLGMTATPKIIGDDRGEGTGSISLDREDQVGPVAHRLGVAEAIARRLVADYRLVVAVINNAEIAELLRTDTDGQSFVKVGNTFVTAAVFAKAVAVLRAAAKHNLRRLVTFHGTVASARAFAMLLPQVIQYLPEHERPPALWTGHVHGEQTSATRNRLLDQFRTGIDGLAVLANARLLTTGFDLPDIDGVCLIDPRKSPVEVTQIAGRALRFGENGKDKIATFLIPVFVDQGPDPLKAALADESFGSAISTIHAVASHDERLAENLRRYRRDRLHRARTSSSPASTLPAWVSFEGLDIPDGFVEAITTAAVRSRHPAHDHLRVLADYRQEFGHLQVPDRWVSPAGLATGTWLTEMKGHYRASSIDPDIQRQLEELGVVWDVHEERYQRMLGHLAAFVQRENHADVPTEHTEQGEALGTWVKARRADRRAGRLSPERTKALEDLGLVWALTQDRHELMFALLEAFVRREGHAKVPADHIESGKKLGSWVRNRLTSYRQGKMPADMQQRLEDLGVVLHALEDRYQQMVALLAAFARREGHVRVPGRHREGGEGLGQWLRRQQEQHADGKLLPHRQKALADLGVVFASPGAPAARKPARRTGTGRGHDQ